MRRTRTMLFLLSTATAAAILCTMIISASIPAVAALVVKTPASSSSSSSSPSKQPFAEIVPLKAAMLTKSWQGLLPDVDQKIGIVPELGQTSVAVQRFGPELERRTLCKRQFERFYEASFAMALADKNPTALLKRAKRLVVPHLLIDGTAFGPRCKAFACLTMPATIALVEVVEAAAAPPTQEEDGDGCCDCDCDCDWSVLMLIVNPTERSIDAIVAAERTMLRELYTLMNSNATTANGGGSASKTGMLRVLDKAKDTLAGDEKALGLTPIPTASEGSAEAENGGDDDTAAAAAWYRYEP